MPFSGLDLPVTQPQQTVPIKIRWNKGAEEEQVKLNERALWGTKASD
jgi:hypothetical protein